MSHLNKFLFTLLLGLSIVLGSCSSKEEDPEPGQTTELELTIVNENGVLQSDATVKLYSTSDDMAHETNMVASKVSDSKGKVNFTGLNAAYYYFRVTKDFENNIWRTEKTVAPLTSREKTSMTVLID